LFGGAGAGNGIVWWSRSRERYCLVEPEQEGYWLVEPVQEQHCFVGIGIVAVRRWGFRSDLDIQNGYIFKNYHKERLHKLPLHQFQQIPKYFPLQYLNSRESIYKNL
jgi:hypothetical protein